MPKMTCKPFPLAQPSDYAMIFKIFMAHTNAQVEMKFNVII